MNVPARRTRQVADETSGGMKKGFLTKFLLVVTALGGPASCQVHSTAEEISGNLRSKRLLGEDVPLVGVSFVTSGSSAPGSYDASVEAKLVEVLERDGQYTGEPNTNNILLRCVGQRRVGLVVYAFGSLKDRQRSTPSESLDMASFCLILGSQQRISSDADVKCFLRERKGMERKVLLSHWPNVSGAKMGQAPTCAFQ